MPCSDKIHFWIQIRQIFIFYTRIRNYIHLASDKISYIYTH